MIAGRLKVLVGAGIVKRYRNAIVTYELTKNEQESSVL